PDSSSMDARINVPEMLVLFITVYIYVYYLFSKRTCLKAKEHVPFYIYKKQNAPKSHKKRKENANYF
ncbi:MAG: hypothetical protein J6Y34_07500, partial [Bacteroidales bacterium]|nr:hypothetical protein [Bacteroidales bacterium]